MEISKPLAQAFSGAAGGFSEPLTSLSQFNSTYGTNINKGSSLDSVTSQLQGASEDGPLDIFGSAGPNKHVLFNMYKRKEPLFTFCWFCVLPTVNGFSLDWNYVEEFTAPFRSFDTVNQYRTGRVYHYAGQHSISNLSMRLYDDSSGKTGAYLENWRGAVMSGPGVYNYPEGLNGYKKNITLIVLDITRITQVYKFEYLGCWPVTSEPYNLQSANSDRLILSQEFSVDDVRITVRDVPVGGLANLIFSSLEDFPNNLVKNLSGTAGFNPGALSGVYDTALNKAKSFFS